MSDLLARLIAAGTPADLIAEVAMEVAMANIVRRQEADELARKEEKRAANARRQREFKAKSRTEVTQGNADNALPTLVTVTGVTSPALSLSPNENNSNPHTHTHPDNNPVREQADFHVLAWIEHCKKPAKAGRAKPPHRMPEGWEPILTEAAQRIVDGWPPGYFDEQVAAFRDHAADKGRTSKDWQAAFRTWITNANRWKPKDDRSPNTRRQPAPPRGGDHLGSTLDLLGDTLARQDTFGASWAS